MIDWLVNRMIDWLTYLLTDWSVWLVSEPSRWSRYFWQFSQTGWFTPTQCNRYSTDSLSVLSYNVLQQNTVAWLGLEWCRLSLAGAATSIIFVVTKHAFCHYKSVFVVTKLLSRQTCFCCNKYNFCCDKFTFVTTNTCCRNKTCLLLQQKYACHDESFVMAKVFVATKIFCHDKQFCCGESVVMARMLLLRQKMCGSSHQWSRQVQCMFECCKCVCVCGVSLV